MQEVAPPKSKDKGKDKKQQETKAKKGPASKAKQQEDDDSEDEEDQWQCGSELQLRPLVRQVPGGTRSTCAPSCEVWRRLAQNLANLQEVSEYVFVYGSKRWKPQLSVDSQLRTQLTKQPPQSSSKENFFVRVRFGGVPSTVEEVVRVRLCCLLSWKTNTGNTGRTVLGHRPKLASP